jgi:hypothetical protein
MTEFDFDVITGPSGPMRRGPSACGWTPAEESDPSAHPPSILPAWPVLELDRRRDAAGEA